MLDIALLGTGGMMPLPNRFLTSLMLRLNGRYMLIDCGEGTQVSIKILGWGFKKIDLICFTHFHADHISGLPGLLLTIGNSGRTEPLTLIGPKGLNDVYNGLTIIAPELPFEVICIELEDFTQEFKISEFLIKTLPVEHRIPCFAYSIDVNRQGKFDIEKARANNVPLELWGKLQKEDEVEYNGQIYNCKMVLGESRKGIKISYCTDSRPTKSMPEFVQNSDLFVCEGLHGDNDMLEKSIDKFHMIFSEAAEIATSANVKELWLTHFSPALTEPDEYISFAKNIFKNTVIPYDRITKTILFDD